ncbi:phospho-acceptor domain-containing protein [Roseimicrobium gellanilyticum]|uniref:histidine kinase n=1 Tax=Roseimicrobium gellanilyticum TaxID=748857 RepID=A0A366H9P0_9BACT|nr:ATP-binding protein [Roseimicrobium gellanilyticum]RBP38143.1 phospho-acceptor domain-containing protein [Roseimicrobium gellanilyticum]
MLLCGIVSTSPAAAQPLKASSTAHRLPSSNGKESIEIVMNGEALPTLGLPSVSLPPVSQRFTVYMTPERPRRRRYQLEGVDSKWKESLCGMSITLRFLNAAGQPLQQDSEAIIGETQGWNGSLQTPVFVKRKMTATAPPGTSSCWLVISSAGPPETLGTLLIKGLKISRTSTGGLPEVVLRAPVGHDPRVKGPVFPAPTGFTADGKRPKMASLLTLAATLPDGQPEECFAIIDDDANGHAEWRTLADNALAVGEGDRLDLEWEEASSVSGGFMWFQDYRRPPPGTYQFRVHPIDLQGQPDGEETTLAIVILAPWWQQGWVWALAVAGAGALLFALSRYIAHQRLRNELTRMKEAALRKAENELTRMARATALGEFTASIAHEISQPLAGITTNASASLRWLSPDRCDIEEARAATQRIIGDADRMIQIVARIRALLAKEKLIRESSNINAVIEELLPLLSTDIRRRGVELQCCLSPDLPTVAIDRVQIQQVIMNLVINGLDAMNGISDRPRELRILTGRDAETLLVKVEDSGTGLDPETVGRLFERFFTTKPEGLGMGLAICQSIVVSHGGRLVAISNPTQGATFQFTLPIETRVIP